jgi:glutathione S-transferase
MLKFYHSTGTCSLASHIVLEELALPHVPIEVSFSRNLNVTELDSINPLGAVPALVADDGKVLTQNVTVLEYLADLKPSGGLLAPAGSWERRETLSWVALVASDLQKAFSPLFRLDQFASDPAAQKEIQAFVHKQIRSVLGTIDRHLASRDYLVGSKFTIADAYLFTIAGWTKWVEIDTSDFSHLGRFMKRVFERPAVQRALKSEDALDYL